MPHRYRVRAMDGSLPDMEETCTEPLQEGVRLVWVGNRHVVCEVYEMPTLPEASLEAAGGIGIGVRDEVKNGMVVLYSALVNSLLMLWGVVAL